MKEQEVIVIFNSIGDLVKLEDTSYFINNWRYPKDEICEEGEFGKIEFYDLTIRFHLQPERSKREDKITDESLFIGKVRRKQRENV